MKNEKGFNINFNYGTPLSPDDVESAIEKTIAENCLLAVDAINTSLIEDLRRKGAISSRINISVYSDPVWEKVKGMYEDEGWEIKPSVDNDQIVIFKIRKKNK